MPKSVYLPKALEERVTASGKRVTELIELGLALSEAQQAWPDAAAPPAGPVTAGDCKHPQARRDRKSGLCNACGTNVGTTGRTP